MPREPKKQLTDEQRLALVIFASQYGHRWKSKLRAEWESSFASGHELASPLLQVRNQFGPSWLVDFNLWNRRSIKPDDIVGTRVTDGDGRRFGTLLCRHNEFFWILWDNVDNKPESLCKPETMRWLELFVQELD